MTGFPAIWAALYPAIPIIPDDDTLALDPEAHDLVIHAMGLHWANDPVGQLIQCRRALRPDGLLIAVGFGGQTLSELRGALGQAEAALTGGLHPRIAPMAEIRDLGALLQRAGLALPVADALVAEGAVRRPSGVDPRPAGDGRNQCAARPHAEVLRGATCSAPRPISTPPPRRGWPHRRDVRD